MSGTLTPNGPTAGQDIIQNNPQSPSQTNKTPQEIPMINLGSLLEDLQSEPQHENLKMWWAIIDTFVTPDGQFIGRDIDRGSVHIHRVALQILGDAYPNLSPEIDRFLPYVHKFIDMQHTMGSLQSTMDGLNKFRPLPISADSLKQIMDTPSEIHKEKVPRGAISVGDHPFKNFADYKRVQAEITSWSNRSADELNQQQPANPTEEEISLLLQKLVDAIRDFNDMIDINVKGELSRPAVLVQSLTDFEVVMVAMETLMVAKDAQNGKLDLARWTVVNHIPLYQIFPTFAERVDSVAKCFRQSKSSVFEIVNQISGAIRTAANPEEKAKRAAYFQNSNNNKAAKEAKMKVEWKAYETIEATIKSGNYQTVAETVVGVVTEAATKVASVAPPVQQSKRKRALNDSTNTQPQPKRRQIARTRKQPARACANRRAQSPGQYLPAPLRPQPAPVDIRQPVYDRDTPEADEFYQGVQSQPDQGYFNANPYSDQPHLGNDIYLPPDNANQQPAMSGQQAQINYEVPNEFEHHNANPIIPVNNGFSNDMVDPALLNENFDIDEFFDFE
ncbi:hypothetical protein B0T17DRAFT_618178 [Bombardia bombarda]|uniref:Uncharacterized protein n=1 Tax=Bombardia bombarda TaxID=252184 RepID=A0AA39WUE6_9PEZI|nr:hypothetical protein B0T17DRAFT_618178 [Bombardia bombarda]